MGHSVYLSIMKSYMYIKYSTYAMYMHTYVQLFCRKAMLMLRKKKYQETLLDKTDKQLENIERMVRRFT